MKKPVKAAVHVIDDPDVDAPVSQATPPDDGLVWEPWSPDGHTYFNRVAESCFGKKSRWTREIVRDEVGKPVHSVDRRPLSNGRTVVRPYSYIADDQVEG